MRKHSIHSNEVDSDDEVAKVFNEVFGELRQLSSRTEALERKTKKKKKGAKNG